MALTKTPEEIKKLRAGGALLSRALQAAVDAVKPGIVIRELDKIAEKVIRDGGGEPSFLGYKSSPSDEPFPSTLCISINEELVHGTATRDIVLKEGDIVGLDIGCWYEELCTDMAATVAVGRISEEAAKLMRVTKEAMEAGVAAAKVGGFISDIGVAVEAVVKPYGYGIVRALVGHGVGHEVHEAPHVPNFVSPHYPKVEIVDGMVLAIEPMVALGGHQIETAKDGWTIVMSDGELSAQYEVTVACTKEGTEILTPQPNL